MAWSLYILELEPAHKSTIPNWYVGITPKLDPYDRINKHFAGKGAKWTQLHAPVRVAALVPLHHADRIRAHKIEDDTTQKLMAKKGEQFVRGGRWCCTYDPKKETGWCYDLKAGDATGFVEYRVASIAAAITANSPIIEDYVWR